MRNRTYEAVTAYVTPEVKEALRHVAFAERMSVSDYIESLIEKALREQGEKK